MTPLAAQEVDIAFSNTQAGIEPIVFPASPAADGTWRVTGVVLPRLENWHVRIDVLINDFERISLATLSLKE